MFNFQFYFVALFDDAKTTRAWTVIQGYKAYTQGTRVILDFPIWFEQRLTAHQNILQFNYSFTLILSIFFITPVTFVM